MNYHKKVQVGGDLGAELERIWAAIRSNQIKSSAGQRINRTPNGTTISFGTASAEAPASTTVRGKRQATVITIPNFVGQAPTSTQDLAYANLEVEVVDVVNFNTMALLPPISASEIFPSNELHTFEYEGKRWPDVLSPAAGMGGYWKWSTDYAFTPRHGTFDLNAFQTPIPAGFSTNLFPQNSGGSFKYYIDPIDYQHIDSGGWVWV